MKPISYAPILNTLCPSLNETFANSTLSDTRKILTNPIFVASNVGLVAVSSMGFILNIPLILALILMRGQHQNLRILIGNTSFCCMVASFCCVVKSLRALTIRDYSKFLIPTFICKTEDYVFGGTYACLAIAMVFVAVERFVATSYHEGYHAWSSGLGWCLALTTWFTGMGLQMFQYWGEQCGVMPYCHLLFAPKRYTTFIQFLSFFIIVSLAVIPLYYLLVRINKNKLKEFADKQAHFSLASRLELRHNIGTAEIFIPTVILHSLHTVLMVAVNWAWLSQFSEFMPLGGEPLIFVKYMIYAPICDVVSIIQSIIFPAVIISKHSPVRLKLYKALVWLIPSSKRYFVNENERRRSNELAVQQNMTPLDHIRCLEAQWVTNAGATTRR